MKTALRFLFGLTLLLGASELRAKEPGAKFLDIIPVAQSAALGNAGTALVTNSGALFMNPAGLGLMEEKEVMFTHSILLMESSLNSIGYAHPFISEYENKGVFGVSALYLTRGKFEARNASGQQTGSFEASDMSIGMSYSHLLGPRSSYGITLKAINQKIENESSAGYAADFGLRAETPVRGLSAAIGMKNIGPQMSFVGEKYSLPSRAEVGLSFGREFYSLISDLSLPLTAGETNFSIGAELRPVSSVFLRGGYSMDMASSRSLSIEQNEELGQFAGFGGGLGLRVNSYQFDYALMPQSDFEASHRITFRVVF